MENNHTDNKGILRSEAGRFLPGSGGRPHGAKNKARMELQKFVQRNLQDLQGEYDSLEPKDKLRFLQSVLGFVIPRLQSETDSEGNDIEQPLQIQWNRLKPETLKDVLNNTSNETE